MKLSKTPPINQAWRGIDFLSSFPSSLSLPAPFHSEASDVSRCETNVARRVKEWPALTNTCENLSLPFFFFSRPLVFVLFTRPDRKCVRLLLADHIQQRCNTRLSPCRQVCPRFLPPTPPIYMGLTTFPHNEIFTGHWFPEK